MHVWFEDNRLCAVMPALILFYDVFEPMWRLPRARVDGDVVCIPAPRTRCIVRSGSGFGRRGNEKYYLVDPERREVIRLRHRAVRKLYGGWMICVRVPPDDSYLCFEWEKGRLRTARFPYT